MKQILILVIGACSLVAQACAQYPFRTYIRVDSAVYVSQTKAMELYRSLDTSRVWWDIEGTPSSWRSLIRVRDTGQFPGTVYSALSAVNQRADSGVVLAGANTNGEFFVSGRRTNATTKAVTGSFNRWMKAMNDSTVWYVNGVERLKLTGSSGMLHFPVGKNDTLATLSDVGGGWTQGVSKIYQKTAGHKVHVRAAASDTNGTALLNVYGDLRVTEGNITVGPAFNLVLTNDAGNATGAFSAGDLTANRGWTMPNVSGTVITTGNLANITAVGTIASGTWQGSTISASYLPSAGSGTSGIVNTSAQTFGGLKTFNNGIKIGSGLDIVNAFYGLTSGSPGATTHYMLVDIDGTEYRIALTEN